MFLRVLSLIRVVNGFERRSVSNALMLSGRSTAPLKAFVVFYSELMTIELTSVVTNRFYTSQLH